MTDAPIRVEVQVCPPSQQVRAVHSEADQYDTCECGESWGVTLGYAPEGSLTEAMMQLAEARMAIHDYRRSKQNRHMSRTKLSELYAAEDAALARVRERRGT